LRRKYARSGEEFLVWLWSLVFGLVDLQL
jgi:hypothetical protein